MYVRYMYSKVKYNSYFFIGLIIGFCIALNIPVDDQTNCDWGLAVNNLKGSTDDYEPHINPDGIPLPKTIKNIQRPRYYSTELGIRDKLFVGVMSSEESLNTKATAINKTLAHITTKIKFFITANGVKNNFSLTNVVAFTDTREMLKPFHILKYISDNYLEEFDYFFIINDAGYVNGRKLMDVVDRISVSEDVYMGTPGDRDSHYCLLDTGILLSNSVLKNIHSNLDWCVRNSYSPQHFENIGRCVLHSTSLKCRQEIQGQRLGSVVLADEFKPTPVLADVVSAYPITDTRLIYKLHAYVSRIFLERSSQDILSLRSYLVSNVRRHPEGYRNSSWPGGLRNDGGMAPPKPETRFDHMRWTSFNISHAMFPDDQHTLIKLYGNTKKAIDLVLEAAWHWSEVNWPSLEPAGFLEGQWLYDPARSLNYLLLLRFWDKENESYVTKRLEVCKPLGSTHILPVPYVTESSKISMVLPILPTMSYDTDDIVETALQFMSRFHNLCLKKADKSFLLLVFLYRTNDTSKGDADPYDKLKMEAVRISEAFKDTGGKVEWVSVRLPPGEEQISKDLLRAVAFERAMSRFSRDTLILLTTPDMEFTEEFLNRVRMNTIMNHQVFSAMPFVRFTYIDKNKPTSNTGHFDNYNTNIMSFYLRDYEAQRTKLTQLPEIKVDNDLGAFFDVAHSINLSKHVLLQIMLNATKIHIMRAPEPGLIISAKKTPPCKDSDQYCLNMLESNEFASLNLGAKSNLAKLILQETDL